MVATPFEEIIPSTLLKSWRKAWPEVDLGVDTHCNDYSLVEKENQHPPDNVGLISHINLN